MLNACPHVSETIDVFNADVTKSKLACSRRRKMILCVSAETTCRPIDRLSQAKAQGL
jgi:hypothetical protein